MYTVARDDAGTLTIRRTAGGARIAEDTKDQGYCDFLTWLSKEKASDGPDFFLDGPAAFFADKGAFAEHCKAGGVMLYARQPSVASAAELAVSRGGYLPGGQRLLGQPPFARLCRAYAGEPPPDMGAPPYLTRVPAHIFVNTTLLNELNQDLLDDGSDARRLSSWPICRCFVYIDVSDFSKTPAPHQALIVNSILAIVHRPDNWHYGPAQQVRGAYEASLCIGDGYIFVFRKAVDATYFAAYLAQLTEELAAARQLPVPFHFRMGVHVGAVYCFWDAGREKWNYIGDGINGGNRVLNAIGKEIDDILFISDAVRQELLADKDRASPARRIIDCLVNRGRRADKHGNLWRVYELNHTQLISGNMPPDLTL